MSNIRGSRVINVLIDSCITCMYIGYKLCMHSYKWLDHWDEMSIVILRQSMDVDSNVCIQHCQQNGWLIFVTKMDKLVLVLHEIYFKIHASYVINVSVNRGMDWTIETQ
eukprot:674036_1